MPDLQPFTGHVVAAPHAAAVVAPPFDALSDEQRRAGLADPDSFLGVLPPRREDDPATLARCRDHLDRLLTTGRFVPLDRPALAVLAIDDGEHRAVAVVGDVAAAAFDDGTILPHERVRPDAVTALRRHLETVGAVSSPVCLAHAPDATVTALAAEVTAGPPAAEVEDDAGRLTTWLVTEPERRAELAAAIGATQGWLVADGHHRAAAARPWGRVLCALVPDDQLAVLAFHRRVRVDPALGAPGDLLRDRGLAVEELTGPAAPRGPDEVTVAGDGRWWRVRLPPAPAGASAVTALDAVRAEAAVLAPLLGERPATVRDDPRIEAVPPTAGLEGLPRPGTVAVALHPPALAEIRRVAAAGDTMPPKTTYVVPKQRSGALVVPRAGGLP